MLSHNMLVVSLSFEESTLMVALLRIVELDAGAIEIDGILRVCCARKCLLEHYRHHPQFLSSLLPIADRRYYQLLQNAAYVLRKITSQVRVHPSPKELGQFPRC